MKTKQKKQTETQLMLREFASSVAAARFRLNLSFVALAERCNVSVATLSRLEKNQIKNISIGKLIEIARVIGVDLTLKSDLHETTSIN